MEECQQRPAEGRSRAPDLELIAGMNLPLVITLATQVNRVSQEELAAIIQESQQSIVNCKKLLVEATAEEDEL